MRDDRLLRLGVQAITRGGRDAERGGAPHREQGDAPHLVVRGDGHRREEGRGDGRLILGDGGVEARGEPLQPRLAQLEALGLLPRLDVRWDLRGELRARHADDDHARRLEHVCAQQRHPLLPPHALELLELRQEVDLCGEGGKLRLVAAARRAAGRGVGARRVEKVLDRGAYEGGGGRALDLLEPLAPRAAHDDAHPVEVEVVDSGGDDPEEGRVDVAELGARRVAEPDLVAAIVSMAMVSSMV